MAIEGPGKELLTLLHMMPTKSDRLLLHLERDVLFPKPRLMTEGPQTWAEGPMRQTSHAGFQCHAAPASHSLHTLRLLLCGLPIRSARVMGLAGNSLMVGRTKGCVTTDHVL